MTWFDLESGHLGGLATFFTSHADVGLDHAARTDSFLAVTAGEAGSNVRMPVTGCNA